MSARLFDDPPLKLTAAEVKDALRRRHPAVDRDGVISEWTCLEEWMNIDLLASSAWSNRISVGYEVKVSRGDYRTELLHPAKRRRAVDGCHEFYFAVPRGLLKQEEVEWQQPDDWTDADIARADCPGVAGFGRPTERQAEAGATTRFHRLTCRRGQVQLPMPSTTDHRDWRDYTCPTCGGSGDLGKSRAEIEAPTLWIPPDVGLIEVAEHGARIVKPAPRRVPENPIVPRDFALLLRWASVRPDPRHAARDSRPAVERARAELVTEGVPT